MPRREEVLTPAQRFQLFAFPDDESELIRLATAVRLNTHATWNRMRQ
ncbi:hypothetical protein SAMN05192544_10365 [Paraburkholderia hospita]|nr:hypothetical protein SAMN05192544_10365 [Paraburkholderia hospita]